MKLYSPKTINDIKSMFNFSLSKGLGQNFLTDKNIIDAIISQSNITENDLVIEIGPGFGVITREIAQIAKEVVAIEIDKRLISVLEYTLSDFNNVKIINEDILKVDINKIIKDFEAKGKKFDNVRIIGNLPYYITTPIIMKILEDETKVDSITIMMQKEVADRIEARENKKDRGALSVAVQFYCDVNRIVNVSKNVFVPPPKIDSTVLRLDMKKEATKVADRKVFFEVVRSGFAQRRKTLLNSLSSGLGISKDNIEQILVECNIDSKRRAETLSMEEFQNLSNKVFEKRGNIIENL